MQTEWKIHQPVSLVVVSSSMSPCLSTAFEASSSPGPSPGRCEGVTTVSERKIKESKGYPRSVSIMN